MIFAIIMSLVVFMILGTYYLVAVPALSEMYYQTMNNAAVVEAGRDSIADLIYMSAIYVVPVVIGVGFIIYLFVRATRTESSAYRRPV